jgi:hypothetical protein
MINCLIIPGLFVLLIALIALYLWAGCLRQESRR